MVAFRWETTEEEFCRHCMLYIPGRDIRAQIGRVGRGRNLRCVTLRHGKGVGDNSDERDGRGGRKRMQTSSRPSFEYLSASKDGLE
jgi:hypothetical protein